MIRANEVAIRVVNGAGVAGALIGLYAWGALLFLLLSGCLGITC